MDKGLASKVLEGVVYRCRKCNEDIYYDSKYHTKNGIWIPMSPDNGKYHKCKTTVHKRKCMLRVLNKTQIGYYKTLGLYPGATVAQIEDAFNYKVKMWHPDLAPPGHLNEYSYNYRKVVEAHNNIRLIYVADE
jgi:hypothetical protein